MLWDGFDILPINRASEHGSAKVGGGYGMRCRGNWELMGTSVHGVNRSGPSFQVLPGW